MPRSHGRIMTSIWTDRDFIALNAKCQRLYMFLVSQSDLTHAGLLPLRPRRWASKVADQDTADICAVLDHLARQQFVVLDEDTEELLIRTFVRNDGVYKQPKVMLRMREDAQMIESPRLRAAFLAELTRLPLHELSDKPAGKDGDLPSTRATVEGVVKGLREDFERVSDTHSEGYDIPPRGRAGALPLPPSPSPLPPEDSSSEIAEQPRPDVDRLCTHLADCIEANGSKRPTVTARWRDSARLLLDRDGRTEDQVHACIEWCQRDEFWRSNVMSMPKLREQYDQLRLKAQAEKKKPQQNGLDLEAAYKRAEERDRSAS